MMKLKGLPVPPKLWSSRVLGPSAVFSALAIGSGELVFWPNLVLPGGPGVLMVALAVVGMQWFVDVEIARYPMATGWTVPGAIAMRSRRWGVLLFLGAIVPWLWPGWARAGAQLAADVTGAPEPTLSVISLLLCGLFLGVSRTVYKSVELVQALLLAFILLGIGLLLYFCFAAPSAVTFAEELSTGVGLDRLVDQVRAAEGTAFFALLGGVVFAGAGGALNLGYGSFVLEKGFGMASYASRVGGLFQSSIPHAPELDPAEITLDRGLWRRWIRLVRFEHGLLFGMANAFTIVGISYLLLSILGRDSGANGTQVVSATAGRLAAIEPPYLDVLFVGVAAAVFFTSELGIIDTTSRIGAELAMRLWPKRLSQSQWYHALVWVEVILGSGLVLVDPRQPYWFLVTTGVLNTAVMAMYIVLTARLNRGLSPVARPSSMITLAQYVVAAVYGSFFIATLLRLL